jgi:hypothetical protein
MKRFIFILIMITILMSCGSGKTSGADEGNTDKKYSDFWTYFKSVEEKAENISNLDAAQQKELLDGLRAQLGNIDSNLGIEFTGKEKELFITAEGVKTSFSNVEKLAESAPKDLGWKVTAFRQRKKLPFSLKFDNSYILNSDDILFKITEDGELLDIMVFFVGQEELQELQRKQVIFIFLDAILGEYDTETYIGAVEIDSGPDSTFVNAEKFRGIVDDFKKKVKNTE